MYYIGIDLGSSSIKIALVEASTGKKVTVVQEPEEEMSMMATKPGWAEQSPELWWELVCKGIKRILKDHKISPANISGLGIAYQMHGLVIVDTDGIPLRNSIIWCDSRAVEIGNRAYKEMGEEKCDTRLLNAPGNFTASKLAWVRENEPEVFDKVYKFMLPGDYIGYRLTGKIASTISGLSEGVFWDFVENQVSKEVLKHYGIPESMVPDTVDTFGNQGEVSKEGAQQSGLLEGTPILYRSGDQPNNALSLNIFEPGEVAATGGTSGVVYAITDNLSVKESSRVNNFAHVNYRQDTHTRIGKLLCINGSGIQYRWLLNNLDVSSYEEMNDLASKIGIGSDGLSIIPFGNGAERMLNNQDIGTRIVNLDLNRHSKAHLCRAALEGIAFSFVYGMEIMSSDGAKAKVIRAGNDNLFRSAIFAGTISTLIQEEIEIYNTTGAIGAARACAIYEHGQEKFTSYMDNDHVMTYRPHENKELYQKAYENWKNELQLILKTKK